MWAEYLKEGEEGEQAYFLLLAFVFFSFELQAWQAYNPWGCKESDTTERLHFHFLSYITYLK